MKKLYKKPITQIINTDSEKVLTTGSFNPIGQQCDCTQHRKWGGCNNCNPRTCGCGECNK